VLEGRIAPAVYVVTDLTDTDPGGNGDGNGAGLNGDLRYCVRQANLNPMASSINFQPGLTGTVSLMKQLDDITTNITAITGLGSANTTIRRDLNADDDFSIFVIASTNTTLNGMAIRKGTGTLVNNALLGGGIYVKPMASAQVVACAITDNTAFSGGGVCVQGTITITGTAIIANQATQDGGGINSDPQGVAALEADTTVNGGSVIAENSATRGGGIFAGRNLTLVEDSTVSLNSATTGGGLYNASSPADGPGLQVKSATVSANSASTGGGVYDNGKATISESTISANGASTGGGVYDDGKATISESTIVANVAWNGGGVYTQGGAMTTVTNATIFGNSFGDQSPPPSSVGPFDSNPQGGNVYVESGATFSVVNTIMATPGGSGDSPDVYGTIQSLGHNMVLNPTGGSGYAPSDRLGFDPQLGPLQDNGGPTLTMMPLPTSFAIDGGDNSYVDSPYDQRGYPRIQDGIVDIGAVETPYSPPPITAPGPNASILLNDLAHASKGNTANSSGSGLSTTQASTTVSSPPFDLSHVAITRASAQLHGKARMDDDGTGL
jgi:hypothetical protein